MITQVKKEKHLHTYVRSKRNKKIYRCVHPDCTHYTDRDNLRGKRAMCRCGTSFIVEEKITDKHLRRAELKCDVCLGLIPAIINPDIIEQIIHPEAEFSFDDLFEFDSSNNEED